MAISMNPDFEDAIVEEPMDDDFYDDMGVTPEEAMSAAYEEMLAGFGLEPADLEDMMAQDGVGEDVGYADVETPIAFDATRSLDDYGRTDELQLPFPEVEDEKQSRDRRFQAKHNEPAVARVVRHIPNKPEFDQKTDVGADYEK